MVGSLLDVDFWREGGGLERPWWNGVITAGEEAEWERWERSPVAMAALQWRRVIVVTEEETIGLGKNGFLEVRYEDFVIEPQAVPAEIMGLTEVPASADVERYLHRRV